MKYDVYADASNSGSDDLFMLSVSGATAEFISHCTGIHIEDFNESMTKRGFVEFEVGRKQCALVIPTGTKIPDDAYMCNRHKRYQK